MFRLLTVKTLVICILACVSLTLALVVLPVERQTGVLSDLMVVGGLTATLSFAVLRPGLRDLSSLAPLHSKAALEQPLLFARRVTALTRSGVLTVLFALAANLVAAPDRPVGVQTVLETLAMVTTCFSLALLWELIPFDSTIARLASQRD